MSVSLHPSSTLGFPRPLTQTVKRTLTISNNNVQPVAFKVKTTAPKLYCVRPNSGRVEPGQSVEVQVMLQAMKEEPPLAAKCKDKFLIQSTTITPEKETLSLNDIWNTTDGDTHSQKIRVTYLPPEGTNIPEEEEPAPVPPVLPSMINPGEQYHTTHQANGRGAPPIPDFDDTRDHQPFEEPREDVDPVPVVNVAVHHPPPRQPTPPPSQEQDLGEKLAEATAEIARLRALLAAMPEPEAKEELRRESSGLRRRPHRVPSTVTGTETEVSNYVDEPYQPEGVPLQIVIIIALGVFVTTYLFF
ncbi:VAMP-associated protein [Thelephora ganbajun]|uniref:VAMP-associated protein n=1 Tax=Thelephora ganbajun TaxID=370292 RepID=A0ACB6ZIH4_THEGA|nr:VAMP-associated protein [Thelephora ganbajun]